MKEIYICEKCGLQFSKNGKKHSRYCKINKKDVIDIIRLYVDEKYSIRDIVKVYNIPKSIISKILGTNVRTISESNIISHKKYPEKYLHNEKTKEILRIKRLEYIKNNPDKTAWRLSNFSYPEKIFYNKLIENGYDKKNLIIREYSFYPYFIDFAFINEKIAIEIDGSQHLLDNRKEHDIKKDKLLLENNWKIIRITEKEVKDNINHVFNIIDNVLNNTICNNYIKVGILKHKSSDYVKVERNFDGKSIKQIQSNLNQRKVKNRPSKDVLKNDIEKLGYMGTGRKYGVSDNTIRKWIK